MDYKISVIIPTHNRPSLVEQYLESLQTCVIPKQVDSIIIIENGSSVAKDIVGKFKSIRQLRYEYYQEANKSHALNYAMTNIPDDHFILFFDDDVIVSQNIMINYLSAINKMGKRCYYGGPVEVIYHNDPPPELFQFLPDSYRGFSRPYSKVQYSDAPTFLGANWGCFKEDISDVGGFDGRYGPGSKSGTRGQESNMQYRLFNNNIQPVYVPEALVYHQITEEVLNMDWVLKRAYHSNYYKGKNRITGIRILFHMLKYAYCVVINIIFPFNMKRAYAKHSEQGIVHGIISRISK